MPAGNCPVNDYDYITEDLDAIIVAALLTTHATIHHIQPLLATQQLLPESKRLKVRQYPQPSPLKTGLTSYLVGKTMWLPHR